MAVTFDNSANLGVSSSGQTDSYTVNDNTLGILIAVTCQRRIGDNVSAVSYGGDSLIEFAGLNITSSYTDSKLKIWYLLTPKEGANNVVTTIGSGEHGISVSSWTGVDQDTPLDGVVSSEGETANRQASVTSQVGNMVIAGMGTVAGAGTMSCGSHAPMTDTTEMACMSYGGGGNSRTQADGWRAGNAGATVIGWDNTEANRYATGIIGFNVNLGVAQVGDLGSHIMFSLAGLAIPAATLAALYTEGAVAL